MDKMRVHRLSRLQTAFEDLQPAPSAGSPRSGGAGGQLLDNP